MKKLPVIFLCILLCGCKDSETQTVHTPLGMTPYIICAESEHISAPLENEKCMSGAYIEEDIPYNEIDAFEKKIRAEEDIYIHYIKKGEDFPMSFVVNCYAKGKIPMLVLGGDSEYEQAYSIAEICGSLDLPMFIELDYDGDIEKYNSHSALFRGYAPKTALVFGFDADREGYALPEDADWIAVNAFESMSKGTIDSEYENIQRLCRAYSDRSVMLNIAVPVFTADKCNYAVKEACNEIENLYSLASEQSNIGAVNYISMSRQKDGRREYSSRLSESESIMYTYGKAVSSIPAVRYYNDTPYVGYVIGDRVIVTENTALLTNAKDIGTKYSNLKAVTDYTLDNERKRIYLKNLPH